MKLTRTMQIGGVLLLFVVTLQGYAAPSQLSLATALAEEEDWIACRQECRRVELSSVDHQEARKLREHAGSVLEKKKKTAGLWKQVCALPVKGMVGFYRLMVAPALGSRCSLDPSCSHYSMQAAKERGWLGLPMTADRLIREPSVVLAKENPVTNADGRILFADPLSAHIGGSLGKANVAKKTGPR